jgi:2'-5' RNA ligase
VHRCFIALDLDEDVKLALKASVEPIRRASRAEKPRFVDTSGYHVTLKFLGDVHAERLDKVRSMLTQTLASTLALHTHWAGFGGLPRRAKAHVLIGVLRDDRAELLLVQQACEERMVELGFPPETREFKPHATLARFRTSVDLRSYLSLGQPPPGPVSLSAVTLYESVLTPGGAQYHVLERLQLRPGRLPEVSDDPAEPSG